jgi:lysozyme family protein
MSASAKENIISDVISIEGGYSDDPSDSGGKTNWGITEKVARDYGYKGDMSEIPRGTAIRIVELFFWNPLNLDTIEQMSEPLAYELLDTAVNQGVYRAGEYLQRCLNALNNQAKHYDDLNIDSIVGPKTLRALGQYLSRRGLDGEEVLLRSINALQGAFYISLTERRQKDERFLFGWMKNRVS